MIDEIQCIADVPRYHAAVRPDAPALACEGRELGWRELDLRSSRFATGLRALQDSGIAAYLGRNREWFMEAFYGAAKAGWILTSPNWRLAARELAFILNDSQPSILFVETEFLPAIEQVRGEIGVETIVCLDSEASGLESYAAWRDRNPAQDPKAHLRPHDVAMIVYTSGTTGHPKGAKITGDNLMATLRIYEASGEEFFVGRADDVAVIFQPFFHIGGSELAFQAGYYGGLNVLMPDFDVAEYLSLLERYRVRRVALPPTVINMILDHPGVESTDFSRLDYIAYGGAPITPALLRRATTRFDASFVGLFGQTESTGMGTYLHPNEHAVEGAKHMDSVGLPLPGMELKIVDVEQGADLPPGETGEICLRGDATMAGYWNDPEATAKALEANGWLHTGDVGCLDAEGFLYLKDRLKDMIISGGENIYSAEVEAAVAEHPAVNSVVVIGVPDELWGEAVKAVVVLHPGAEATERQIIDFTGHRIARYKRPKSVDFVDELPRNPNGKILKREIRDAYRARSEQA